MFYVPNLAGIPEMALAFDGVYGVLVFAPMLLAVCAALIVGNLLGGMKNESANEDTYSNHGEGEVSPVSA